MHPPSVDALARSLAERGTGLPHPLLVDVAREAITAGDHESAPDRADALARTLLQPVVNATGVLLHTNMGRAPHHMREAGTGADGHYSNLELSLASGQRGSRQTQAGQLFARLCEAEDAMVVNNCAAAVTLTLAALAAGRGVAVSRSELVEIGGGFRVPEVMEQSGAQLVEVGTTNRTRPADFANAVASDRDVALALKVHQSNYRIVGFTEEVHVREITDLRNSEGERVPVVADIGSGLLDAACPWLDVDPPVWLADEPAAKQTLAAGADLVMFSGDKLLGGPQAGIIAGRADLVARCKRHPLARAFRPGGLVLGQLQQLALTYLDRRGADIPFWRMATLDVDALRLRADTIHAATGTATGVETAAMHSVPGGGTLPTVEIPSVGLKLVGDHSRALRNRSLPIIARVADHSTWLDLRTVAPEQDELLITAVQELPALAEQR